MQLLKVHNNGRFLMKEDGSPFFWLGDTAWEIFHRLNREEADFYLETRAKQKFNVIQAVALAEFEGLTIGNAYGRLPLKMNDNGQYDPSLPDTDGEYSYWDHVDYIIDKAEQLGLYVALLPTWGDKYNKMWGKGPEIFDKHNAKAYGQFLGNRYKDRNNIIWILGGDRPLHTRKHFDIQEALAEGLRSADEGRHLISFHPCGENSSALYVNDEPWLDFNMIQSGHSRKNNPNYKMIQKDYERTPVKPVLDGEPCYEDHPINFKEDNDFFDEVDVRKAVYWSVFAGGFGVTYGHHCIWSMNKEPGLYFGMNWKEALNRPAANQMQYLRQLMESRPFFERIPDQSLLMVNYEGSNHQQATRGERYAFVYAPHGISVHVKLGILKGQRVKVQWFNPRTGEAIPAGTIENTGDRKFVTPAHGREQDYVLIMDAEE
ncbi:MAG TPA: DUF4038 domain-containing protein [Clostridiales bacterium]|nr:DUF4038 domain-containing protein [Clostridiales bacterium]